MSKVFNLSGWLSGGVHSTGQSQDLNNNQPPVADFDLTNTGLTYNFSDASTDPDGTIARRSWNFGDAASGSNNTSTARNPQHIFSAPGTYTVTLIVTDNEGATASTTRAITAISIGAPPNANFTFSITGLSVAFTDTSTDTDGTISTRSWVWGDGKANGSGATPTHVYDAGGGFSVTLTVTDNSGNTAQRTKTVTVVSAPAAAFRTRVDMDALDDQYWGVSVSPDFNEQNQGANAWVAATTGIIDVARNAGTGGRNKTPRSCCIMKVTGGNDLFRNSAGDFDIEEWKRRFDLWYFATLALTPSGYTDGIAKIRAAVRDGIIRVMYLLDDFGGGVPAGTANANGFVHAVPFVQLEQLAYHVKVTRNMPWMPCTARARGTYFNTTKIAAAKAGLFGPGGHAASTGYHYMDAAWMQMRLDRDGDIATYIASEWAACNGCKLGGMGGGNLLNGGRSVTVGGVLVHADADWRVKKSGETDALYNQRMHPSSAKMWGMSPNEIKDLGAAMMAKTQCCGFDMWRAGGVGNGEWYWLLPEIQAAMLYVYNLSVGRDEGPINVRGDLVAA